ncbi:MAG: hypothetical protein WAS33_08850, partial [Candidatus Promineifilaceae bacterium]
MHTPFCCFWAAARTKKQGKGLPLFLGGFCRNDQVGGRYGRYKQTTRSLTPKLNERSGRHSKPLHRPCGALRQLLNCFQPLIRLYSVPLHGNKDNFPADCDLSGLFVINVTNENQDCENKKNQSFFANEAVWATLFLEVT